ncbi:MAG: methionyl-tRNA formyltransferase [Bacteroidales bacterium]|nr:methionyl-tRNA formyltransferase [Bacteroidales bacterium]
MNRSLKIVFLGSPDFAVASLKALVENGQNIVGVVTAPDKPAGRGQKIQETAVKQYAVQQGLKVLQPSNLKASDFIEELKALNADLQIVVAFRMLPEVVWNMPRLGTFNLHASLLPQYRGAAPINWAIINGEKETGVSTFFLQHAIDTGDLILQEKTAIGESMSAGELHDKLMNIGANLVVKTVELITIGKIESTPQKQILGNELKIAPKLYKDLGRIDWQESIDRIHNIVRGLSPYPAAWTELNGKTIKIYKGQKEISSHEEQFGAIFSDGKKFLKVAVNGGFYIIEELQIEGKKRMDIDSFLSGYQQSMECFK